MRIIAGEYRGFQLKAPKGNDTRRTTDRVRESMMSSVNSALGGFDDAVVLDAFAGSGALGLEAISRGARSACFYDAAGEAVKIVNDNVKKLGLDARRARVNKADVMKNPPKYARPPFNLVFFDPPYAYGAADVLKLAADLRAKSVVADDALIVYEHATVDKEAVNLACESLGLTCFQQKKYGETVVSMIEFERQIEA